MALGSEVACFSSLVGTAVGTCGSAPGFSPIRETTASPRRSMSQTSEHSKKRDQFNYSLLGRQTSGTWRAIIGCDGETCGDGVRDRHWFGQTFGTCVSGPPYG